MMLSIPNLLISLLKGALIGTGAILPGISGGVLCVALKVYEPIMALLVHPIREFKKDWRFFVPIGVGFLLGVLLLSRLVDVLFRTSPVPAVWLFIGLIVGTVPALWRESGKAGRPKSALVIGAIAFLMMLAALLFLKRAGMMQVETNFWIWLLCGVLWGIGIIAPGLSPSSLFIFMGVYQPMSAGIADFSLPILLPMGAGLVLCVLTLSHFINFLLKRKFAGTMHALLGMSLASTVVILPFGSATGALDVLIYALCFAVGLFAALWMDKVNQKMVGAGQKTE